MGLNKGKVDRISPYFDELELKIRGCPGYFSVGLPNALAFEGLPGFPEAATPERRRMANGRGLSRMACHYSCLGEAAELVSCSAWGNETLIRATSSELGISAIGPEILIGLTDAQRDDRDDWNQLAGSFDWRPLPVSPETAIDWIEAENAVTSERVLAPADFALIGHREAGDETATAIGDSNGCASGETIIEAKIAAILELVERDAVGRWWYGRRSRPSVDLTDVRGSDDLIAYLLERSRGCRLYDITTDIAIPAFAAVSAEPDGRDVALGTAANLDPDAASLSALTEMLQMEIALEMARRASDAVWTWGTWRRDVDMTIQPLSLTSEPTGLSRSGDRPRSSTDQLTYSLAACQDCNCALYFIDLTRPELAVPTIRALSPDLCHFKPRFGRDRLLANDPRDLDRSDEAKRQPNPQLLLV